MEGGQWAAASGTCTAGASADKAPRPAGGPGGDTGTQGPNELAPTTVTAPGTAAFA